MLSASLLQDYATLTQAAGFVEVSARSKMELRGDDRASFLHNFCTNNIKRLQPGESCEAFVCNAKGHTLGFVHIYADQQSLLIDSAPQQAAKLLAHWDRYLIREKVELLDRSETYAAFLLAGPELATRVAALEQPWRTRLQTVANAPYQAQWLWCEHARRDAARAALTTAGLAPCSADAWELVRVEQAWPEYSVDITEENLPQEVNRTSAAISFTKGCYLGQETVARIDALGHVNQTLTRLLFTGSTIPAPGTELSAGGKVVARITSAIWSPQWQQPLALAYVRRGFEASGTQLEQAKVL
jgi:folate-binding protein YgfZ